MASDEKTIQTIAKIDEFLSSSSKDPSTCDIHASDIAEILEFIKQEDEDKFLRYIKTLPKELIAEAILELPQAYQEEVADFANAQTLSHIVSELDTDDATDFIQLIEEQDSQKAQDVLNALPKEHKEDIVTLKQFDDDTAGSIMQFELLDAYLDEKIIDSITRLRQLKERNEVENIHYIFIKDRQDCLLAIISLEDLILLDFEKTFAQVQDKFEKPISVLANENTEEVAYLVEKYDLSVLPVVNEKNQLLGRITSDDIYDLIQESATEQIYSLANVHAEEELEDSVLETGKNRILWLGINLITAIVSALVIGLFDETIQKMVALAVLMPIVASMGGIAGTQTLTVVVRQMALGEIDRQNGMQTLKKEIAIGTINGFAFALLGTFIGWFWFDIVTLGLIMAASLFVNLFFAAFFGTTIPIALKHFDIDPAISSGVLLTTITDVIGFFTFLGLASIVLV